MCIFVVLDAMVIDSTGCFLFAQIFWTAKICNGQNTFCCVTWWCHHVKWTLHGGTWKLLWNVVNSLDHRNHQWLKSKRIESLWDRKKLTFYTRMLPKHLNKWQFSNNFERIGISTPKSNHKSNLNRNLVIIPNLLVSATWKSWGSIKVDKLFEQWVQCAAHCSRSHIDQLYMSWSWNISPVYD